VPIAILAEYVTTFAVDFFSASAASVLGLRLKKDRLDEFFHSLDARQKQAFLDVTAAAVLHDDEVSEDEQKLLARHSSAAGAAQVRAAVEAVREAAPARGPESYRAFLAARAGALGDADHRERALSVASIVLRQSLGAGADGVIRFYGDALGVPPERVEQIYLPG